MPNQYDSILRENFSKILLPFIQRRFNFEILTEEDLPENLQKTVNRQMDFVKRITTKQQEEFILHVEFQTQNDPKIIFRMNLYHALLLEKYQLPIRSVVLYIGAKQAQMRSELHPEEIMTGFKLVDLPSIDHQEFLNSDIPEEIILAILADHQGDDPVKVMQSIQHRLIAVENDPTEQQKFLQQLRVLSRIRKLEYVFSENAKDMPLTFDIKEDHFYQKGVAEGKTEGRAEGRVEGKAEGKIEGKIEMIINLLSEGMPIKKIATIADLPIDQIQEIKKQHKL
ncbi:MAG: hypothetical protein AAF998_22090, partial [Bacteroidota bacterium]